MPAEVRGPKIKNQSRSDTEAGSEQLRTNLRATPHEVQVSRCTREWTEINCLRARRVRVYRLKWPTILYGNIPQKSKKVRFPVTDRRRTLYSFSWSQNVQVKHIYLTETESNTLLWFE